jgi:HSP20 family protein
MMTTQTTKQPGLIPRLRDRLRRVRPTKRDVDVGAMTRTPDWDPLRLMREMLRWEPFAALTRSGWMPHFEVRENHDTIRFIADVPGVRRDDIEIAISGNRLIVSGHRETETQTEEEHVLVFERQQGQFTRAFTLPENIDVDHITSELRDGVLTIVAPMKEGARSRRISIGGASAKS